MNLVTLDVAILSYSAEVCRGIYGEAQYFSKLAKAFEFYEYAISKGWLKSYGISGHNSFTGTDKPTIDKLPYKIQQLSHLIDIAEQVAGKNHNFKHVQAPFNFINPSVLVDK